MILIELLVSFFTIGFFSFGGGYAIISLLQSEALSRGWLTASEFSDILAISQITPGPIAVNMATFVGYRQAGVLGSLLATLGVSLPSLIIILIAVNFIDKFKASKTLEHVFYGLRPAVCGMILAAAVQITIGLIFKDSTFAIQNIDYKSILVFLGAFIAIYKFKISTVKIIIAAAVLGIFLFK